MSDKVNISKNHVPEVGLFQFGDELTIPTELYRLTESFNANSPSEEDFVLATSERVQEASNYYRHFKADLSLTRSEARTPDEEVWSMRTKTGDYTRLNEIIGQSDAGRRTYFNPLLATKMFLSKVCKRSVQRAQKIFGDEQSVQIHFTAPNFKYEGDGEEGKKKSRRYRDNLRDIVGDILDGKGYENVSFQVEGSDFLYEPYGVYYYYSLLEHNVDLNEAEAGNTYLVFDMGGSTTDVAIVQVNRQESDFRLYPICTSISCAGAYFDQYILKDFLGREQVPRRDKKWIPYLDRIEEAKIALCEERNEHFEIEIREDEGGTFQLDRSRLRRLLGEIWRDKNQPLGPGFRGFLGRAQRLARDHGQLLEFDKIENVFLAGGSTGLPGLEELIREDLEELSLLDPESKEICVRPRRQLLSGTSTPNSSLAVLGQTASIAEESQERLLEEGEKIYAIVIGEEGTPYPFQRRDRVDEEGQREEEFLLCTLDELEERSTVRLEPDGDGEFEDVPEDGEHPLISEGEVYLRADVNAYPQDPDRSFRRSDEEREPSSEEESPSLRSRFTAHAELRADRLRVKPFLWNVDPRTERRSTLEAEEEGYLSVSLRPELKDDSAIHICIDLGMNNTAVAIWAAGREIPLGADVETFRMHHVPPEPSAGVATLLATEPMEEEAAVKRIVEAHYTIGYQPQLKTLYRFVRGSCVQAVQHGSALSEEEVATRLAEALSDAMSGDSVSPETLEREREWFAKLFQQVDSVEEVARDVEKLNASNGVAITQEDIEDQIERKSQTSTASKEQDTSDETDQADSVDESSVQVDSSEAEIQSDAMDTPPHDEKQTAQDDDGPNKKDTRGSESRAHSHWAAGMTEWIESALQDALAPIEKSNRDTKRAVERVAKGLEKIVRDQSEQSAHSNGELADALNGLQEAISDLQNQDNTTPTQRNLKVKERVESRVQNAEDPLSSLAPEEEDRSLQAFQDFVEERGYIYSEEVLRRAWMHCVSRASGLVILAGPPGCGKTSLVRLLAEFFNQDLGDDEWEQFHLLQPVSPSWFSPDSLLGSKSVMTEEYQYTPFLKFLIKAESHYMKALTGPGPEHARLFIGCLDEFNIAQPEQYLADILSKMEAPPDSKNRRLHLGTDGTGESVLDVDLTANFKLFATINTDSTTKTLSPKVLDRAIYIPVSPELGSLRQAADQFRSQFEVGGGFHDRFVDVLDELTALSRAGQAPIAYRSIEQGYRYASSHPKVDENPEAVVGDVLISFFLSKLPGAYAINDPEGNYKEQLGNCKKLRDFDEVDRLLNRIEEGLPGQAAL